tara:strand:- start:3 stop:209 length:207 start_codon:yes stop_codon:yes gene_type:complete
MEKKLSELKQKINTLEKENQRLVEENLNYETISKSHKETNGELQSKLTAAENKIKDFEENYIKIDGKK